MNTAPKDKYIPGVCTIGPAEIKSRMQAGWFGLVLTVIIGALLFYLEASPVTRLVLFLPAFIGAIGFLQAYFHFCVAFGSQGLFNVANEAGKTESVTQQEFRKKDQQIVYKIMIYSVLIAAVVAVVASVI